MVVQLLLFATVAGVEEDLMAVQLLLVGTVVGVVGPLLVAQVVVDLLAGVVAVDLAYVVGVVDLLFAARVAVVGLLNAVEGMDPLAGVVLWWLGRAVVAVVVCNLAVAVQTMVVCCSRGQAVGHSQELLLVVQCLTVFSSRLVLL